MNVPTADELAESQAGLNEYLANMIMGEAFNELPSCPLYPGCQGGGAKRSGCR